MAEGPVQNPVLLLPRRHGLFTRDDLQNALRDLAEERLPLGADECIDITLNYQEYLWPADVLVNDMEKTQKHMYFVVLTWEQYLAMENLAGARVNHKWWGYREEPRPTQERSGADLKTKRRIQDDQKIHVNTWNITGALCRRRRHMVDPVTYQRVTDDPLPMPRIVILQWMKYPKMSPLLRAATLNNEPEPPRPRGMDDRGPLPPHLPPPQPQDEGEAQGQGNPGGNNDQEQQQLEVLIGPAALKFDGFMGTEDMSFVKCKLESLVINHHKLEEELAAISTRYASCDELIEKGPHVIKEILNLKGTLASLAMKHDVIEEQMLTISTGLLSIEELLDKAPQVVDEVFSLNGELDCVAMKQKKLEEKMDTIASWFLSSEDKLAYLLEKTDMVEKQMASLSSSYSSWEDKLGFLLEKTDRIEEQMDSLSSSCLSWKENYKVLSQENDNLMEEVISLKENYMVLAEENENLKEVVLSLKKALPQSMGKVNPLGVPVKKTVSIIGMRKAKGKNKEEGLTLGKVNTDIKKEIHGLKKMMSLLWKEMVVFSPVVPGNVRVREVVPEDVGEDAVHVP